MNNTLTVHVFVEPDARASHLAEAFASGLTELDVVVEIVGREQEWLVYALSGASHHDLDAIAQEIAGGLHPRLEIRCHRTEPVAHRPRG